MSSELLIRFRCDGFQRRCNKTVEGLEMSRGSMIQNMRRDGWTWDCQTGEATLHYCPQCTARRRGQGEKHGT